MDINSVMNSYNLNSQWNNSTYTVPKITNVDATVIKKDAPSPSTNITLPTIVVDTANSNKTSQYNSTQDGTLKSDISSILSSNPSMLYKAVDLLGVSQTQNLGNFINLLI